MLGEAHNVVARDTNTMIKSGKLNNDSGFDMK